MATATVLWSSLLLKWKDDQLLYGLDIFCCSPWSPTSASRQFFLRNFDTSQHSTRIQNSELAVASCTLFWRHREELKSLTKAPLQIEREDHAILNGLPLSFPPRSCGFNHSGRSSMASVHMVASFEVADSVRLGMSGSIKVVDAITVFFKGNQVMRPGVSLFFRCCPTFVLACFLFLAAFLRKITYCILLRFLA